MGPFFTIQKLKVNTEVCSPNPILLKLIHYEKATKFHSVVSKQVGDFQIFVAFSEKLDFTRKSYLENPSNFLKNQNDLENLHCTIVENINKKDIRK